MAHLLGASLTAMSRPPSLPCSGSGVKSPPGVRFAAVHGYTEASRMHAPTTPLPHVGQHAAPVQLAPATLCSSAWRASYVWACRHNLHCIFRSDIFSSAMGDWLVGEVAVSNLITSGGSTLVCCWCRTQDALRHFFAFSTYTTSTPPSLASGNVAGSCDRL